MNDLISRQAAVKALQDKVFHNLSDEFYGTMQVLDELPPVDAEPVKHARWKTTECIPLKSKITMCSACNTSYLTVDIIRASRSGERMPDYCPSCGAKMDGGAENDKP